MNNEIVTAVQPRITLGELVGLIETPTAPIKRSTHVGNQPAHELVLMTALPPGIEILMVDTIQGDDQYTLPKMVRLAEENLPLCRRKLAAGRIVGAISVDRSCLPREPNLNCMPEDGETLNSFHTRAIANLQPNNMPRQMLDVFSSQPDILAATMTAAHALGEVKRVVTADGTITTHETADPENHGIFGLDDATPKSEGSMIPLNAMMALDMAISNLVQGADRTTHLAGPHMCQYTQDKTRMRKVGEILTKTASELGVIIEPHRYEVVDITGLGRLVSSATHTSQHQLLLTPECSSIDLDKHALEQCGSI